MKISEIQDRLRVRQNVFLVLVGNRDYLQWHFRNFVTELLYQYRGCKANSFTNEKHFHLNPNICHQNGRVWAGGRKADVKPHRLLVEREKFASRVMVSAGVRVGEKGHLYFVDERAKVIAAYYLEQVLPKLVENCEQLLSNGFIFFLRSGLHGIRHT